MQMPCFFTKFLVNAVENDKAQNLIILDFLQLPVKLLNLNSSDRIIFVCSMSKRKYGKKAREEIEGSLVGCAGRGSYGKRKKYKRGGQL